VTRKKRPIPARTGGEGKKKGKDLRGEGKEKKREARMVSPIEFARSSMRSLSQGREKANRAGTAQKTLSPVAVPFRRGEKGGEKRKGGSQRWLAPWGGKENANLH